MSLLLNTVNYSLCQIKSVICICLYCFSFKTKVMLTCTIFFFYAKENIINKKKEVHRRENMRPDPGITQTGIQS